MTEHPSVDSFRRFIREWLPAALGQVIDVADYAIEEGDGACAIRLTVRGGQGDATVRFEDVPTPRADGSFVVAGGERAVWLTADRSDLEHAEIKGAGEQLRDEIEPRLVAPPEGAEWSAELLQAWLPIGKWIGDFLLHSPTSHEVDTTNWLARGTSLRRLLLPEDDARPHPSHLGRVCPLDTPEGPNCGRIVALAQGAVVRAGRIITVDPSPLGALGPAAQAVPLLEHNDPTRQLFGVNMMRQWLPLPDPEPALVQSGAEPADAGAWTGRNLLTAFVHWQGMNYEDGIVVSESCAARLASPDPSEVGDRLSNRHGTKGVVGAILPDAEMPHLPDGRPADLAFDFTGLHTRRNFGQMLEAVLGNVAHATGQPVVAPPFAGPSLAEIREMLRATGLPDDGQLRLTHGRDGAPLDQTSTVGYVYWGKTIYRARPLLVRWFTEGDPVFRGCRQGELEFRALKTCGAHENILETFGLRSVDHPGAAGLAEALAPGPVAQAGPPSPAFGKLQRLLRVGGIEAAFESGGIRFEFAEPGAEDVALAVPVPHPWRADRLLTHLGPPDGDEQTYRECLHANERAARAPETIRGQAQEHLAQSVRELLSNLALSEALRPGTQTLFSARAVLAPGPDLRLGEIGLPEEMAWALFGPLVTRRVGKIEASKRGPQAQQALAEVLGENVVLMNRAPTMMPTAIAAFRPVLAPGPAIRLHPLCCRMFNGDFDGDQAAIFLPVTEAAQAEARERLTVEAHLRRDPGAMLDHLAPWGAIMYGLAYAAASPARRERLLGSWPAGLPQPPADLTRAWLLDALTRLLATTGPEAVLEALQRLMEVGLAAATASGASLHPFLGARLQTPPAPTNRYPYTWWAHGATVTANLSSQGGIDDPDLGPQLLLARSGARGGLEYLRQIVGPWGPLGGDPFGGPIVTGGVRDGLPPDEYFALASRSRGWLQSVGGSTADSGHDLRAAMQPQSDTVLARALRSDRPGEVFAEAALRGETDPLSDPQVRLLVGLQP